MIKPRPFGIIDFLLFLAVVAGAVGVRAWYLCEYTARGAEPGPVQMQDDVSGDLNILVGNLHNAKSFRGRVPLTAITPGGLDFTIPRLGECRVPSPMTSVQFVRDDEGVLASGHLQPGLDELVGPELSLPVVEDGLEAHGGRGLVDLVVDDRELALAEGLVAVAAQRLDAQRPLRHRLLDLDSTRNRVENADKFRQHTIAVFANPPRCALIRLSTTSRRTDRSTS